MREISTDPEDDDRTDRQTRDRITELTESWHSAVERLDARYRRIAVRQTITSVLIVGLLIFGLSQRRRTDNQSNKNTEALCALRHDLERRVAASDQFLRDHPEGIAGIPAATLKATSDGQKRTIMALSGLNCSTPVT